MLSKKQTDRQTKLSNKFRPNIAFLIPCFTFLNIRTTVAHSHNFLFLWNKSPGQHGRRPVLLGALVAHEVPAVPAVVHLEEHAGRVSAQMALAGVVAPGPHGGRVHLTQHSTE